MSSAEFDGIIGNWFSKIPKDNGFVRMAQRPRPDSDVAFFWRYLIPGVDAPGGLQKQNYRLLLDIPYGGVVYLQPLN